MNEDHFKKFETLLDAGRKVDAKRALEEFLASASSESDKENWVFANLPNLKLNRASRIRHEVFEEIVFPVLLRGFQQGYPWHQYWLGRLEQNLITSKRHWSAVGYISDTELFRRAYLQESENDEYRKALLYSIMRKLDFCDHEWPAGLIGVESKQDFDELDADIAFADHLDREGTYSESLAEIAQHVSEYRQRGL